MLIHSIANLLIPIMALLLRDVLTYFLWNNLYLGNLDSVALLLLYSCGVRFLDRSTLLTGFIQALFIIHSSEDLEIPVGYGKYSEQD